MGMFRVTVVAIGNHGCMRDISDGETVIGCDKSHCTDCITREYVRRMKRSGADVSIANIEHWPTDAQSGQFVPPDTGQVLDNLVTGVRRGTF